eukprot:COSAG04_NODE_696_length_11062_cov_47.390769_10_plen_1261_part_00
MRSCRICDFNVCANCIQASAERAKDASSTATKFRAALTSLSRCHELLAPGLPMPPRSTWEQWRRGWTGVPSIGDLMALEDEALLVRATTSGVDAEKTADEILSSIDNPKKYLAELIVERLAEDLDFSAAFSDSWSVEMDEALASFVQERGVVLEKPASSLTKDDLFDKASSADGASPTDGESTPDKAALHRNVSVAPMFVRGGSPSPRRAKQPTQLSDNSEAAIRARYMLLREWNDIVSPALPLIDLRLFEVEGHIAQQLLICKGRLLPATKDALIDRALELSATSEPLPTVSLNIAAPDAEDGKVEPAFEQLFSQLHGKYPLTNTNKEVGEGQLWEVRMRGEGAAAFTDATDIGGHFRTSLRLLCSDLQSPGRTLAGGKISTPIFIATPNHVRGAGDGAEAAEAYLPNPACTSPDDLERFAFVGTLCGAAARFTSFMELELPSLCWKFVLGQSIDSHELRAVDVKTAAHIESVLAIDDETTWALRQEEDPVCWCIRLANNEGVALRGDGRGPVAFAEREEYAAAAEKTYLAAFTRQLEAMARGFYSVFPQLGARLLTWRELERRVCGLPDVDVSQLQRIAKYEGSHRKGDDYVKTFWQVLRELSGQERKQLLGFVWGRSRLPAHCTTPFTIDSSSSGNDDNQLPMSHTCMFQLHLPRYSSASVLKERLLTAIQNAGQRGDGTQAKGEYFDLAEGMRSAEAPAPTLLLDMQMDDGGHCETLRDFCQRAHLDIRQLERRWGISEMRELLAMDVVAVRTGLSTALDGGSGSGTEMARARAKYKGMTEQQLRTTCADSWLESTGSCDAMVDLLVAHQAEQNGWLMPTKTAAAPPKILEAGPIAVTASDQGHELVHDDDESGVGQAMRRLSQTGSDYFEVRVTDGGEQDVVCVGVAPEGNLTPAGSCLPHLSSAGAPFEMSLSLAGYNSGARHRVPQPGWEAGSVGYHGDDGGLFVENGSAATAVPLAGDNARTFGAGDVVGCGVTFGSQSPRTSHRIFFTLNGQATGMEASVDAGRSLHACVGLKHGAKVVLNTGQADFLFKFEMDAAKTTALLSAHAQWFAESWQIETVDQLLNVELLGRVLAQDDSPLSEAQKGELRQLREAAPWLLKAKAEKRDLTASLGLPVDASEGDIEAAKVAKAAEAASAQASDDELPTLQKADVARATQTRHVFAVICSAPCLTRMMRAGVMRALAQARRRWPADDSDFSSGAVEAPAPPRRASMSSSSTSDDDSSLGSPQVMLDDSDDEVLHALERLRQARGAE